MKKFIKIILIICIVTAVYTGVLYGIQDHLIYYPDTRYESPADVNMPQFKENPLVMRDGTQVMTWYYRGNPEKPAVLFLHGNAGEISYFAPHLRPLLEKGYTVLAMEYRGFGNTKGHIRQQVVMADAAEVFDFLKKEGYEKIVFYGYSLGSGYASALTSLRQADGLILTAPFYSLKTLVAEKPIPFAKYVLKDDYLSYMYLRNFDRPAVVIHGKKDLLIPYHNGERLFVQIPSADKQWHLVENANHHSIFYEEKNVPFVLDFLEKYF